MTVEIPLTRGLVALVDEADSDLVGGSRWFPMEGGRRGTRLWYAYRSVRIGKAQRSQLMHQLITGWARTDHINGNGLDNRRANLRPATRAQNQYNARKRKGTTSVYKGVYWKKADRRWMAKIYLPTHRGVHLGSFTDEVEAARAYDDAARKHFGEYAALNFPLPGERSALEG